MLGQRKKNRVGGDSPPPPSVGILRATTLVKERGGTGWRLHRLGAPGRSREGHGGGRLLGTTVVLIKLSH
jgi:hypothetical protein